MFYCSQNDSIHLKTLVSCLRYIIEKYWFEVSTNIYGKENNLNVWVVGPTLRAGEIKQVKLTSHL